MNLQSLLCATLFLSAALAALSQEPKPDAKAPPKPELARVEAFAYEGSSITAVGVKDLKAAQAWYGKVLGANLFFELEEQGWCEMTTPVSNAMIGLSQNDAVVPSASSTLSFGVQDMAKAKAWLSKNAVKLDGDVVEIPQTVKLLYFRDPDGNRLMFYEPYTGK